MAKVALPRRGSMPKGSERDAQTWTREAPLGPPFLTSLTALSARARYLFDTKVALHRRGSTPKDRESPAQEMTVRLSLVTSFPSL
jgi:hypothetical protein